MRLLVWVLVWVVLVLGAAAYLWVAVRAVLRSGRRLAAELAEAEQQLAGVQSRLDDLDGALDSASDEVPILAVFADRQALRAERDELRRTLGDQRRARRELTRPRWSRRVDW